MGRGIFKGLLAGVALSALILGAISFALPEPGVTLRMVQAALPPDRREVAVLDTPAETPAETETAGAEPDADTQTEVAEPLADTVVVEVDPEDMDQADAPDVGTSAGLTAPAETTDVAPQIEPAPSETVVAVPETAIVEVPAGSEFARSGPDEEPVLPAALPAPDMAELPVVSAPEAEGSPRLQDVKPTRAPYSLTASPEAPSAPATAAAELAETLGEEAPVGIAPPGEVETPVLADMAPDPADAPGVGTNPATPGATSDQTAEIPGPAPDLADTAPAAMAVPSAAEPEEQVFAQADVAPVLPETAPLAPAGDADPETAQVDSNPAAAPTAPDAPQVAAPDAAEDSAEDPGIARNEPAATARSEPTAPETLPKDTADLVPDAPRPSAPVVAADNSGDGGMAPVRPLPQVRNLPQIVPENEADAGTEPDAAGQGGLPQITDQSPSPPIGVATAPRPGFSNAPGVKVNRLPSIGGQDEIDDTPEPGSPEAEPEVATADRPAISRYAAAFDNPGDKPLFSIVLVDTGTANGGLDRDTILTLPIPVTIAIDPTRPDAETAAEEYRAAGFEVMILAAGIPEGAQPTDLEVAFQSFQRAMPEAIGVIDTPEARLQNNRLLAQQLIEVLTPTGLGLFTHNVGLNPARQLAAANGVAQAGIFRVIDADHENQTTIRRYLDRASFEAAQNGSVVVVAHNYPETVKALFAWAARSDPNVVVAPASAVALAQAGL